MSVEKPGQRYSTVATKAVRHKDPTVEDFHPGIALKSTQGAPAAVSVANATAAQQIGIGEECVIALSGDWPVDLDLLPDGAEVGDALYITLSNNALVLGAVALTGGVVEAAYVKFGRLTALDEALERGQVNLNLRDTF